MFYLDKISSFVAKLASKESSRPVLTALAIYKDGRIVATDSYTLMEYQCESDDLGQQVMFEEMHTKVDSNYVLIPAKEFRDFQKFKKGAGGKEAIRSDLSIVREKGEFVEIQSKNLSYEQSNQYLKIEGEYPEYTKILEKSDFIGTFNASLVKKIFQSIAQLEDSTVQLYLNKEKTGLIVINEKIRAALMSQKTEEKFVNPNEK